MKKTNDIPQLQKSPHTDAKRYIGLTELVEEFDPKFVLDFGCSRGLTLKDLAPALPETHFVGVDTNDLWRGRARRALRKRNNTALLSSLKGLQSEQFDMILALSVLMDNSEEGPLKEDVFNDALDVLVRLMKPGGKLISWNYDWDPASHPDLSVVHGYDTCTWRNDGGYKGTANVFTKE